MSAPLSGEARVASWRVFALVFFSAGYFFQSSGHNEAARFDQIRSVAEHGEWWIDRFAWNSADTIAVGDHIYPGKAPGTTFLGVLPWVLARALAGLLPLDETRQVILATYALTLFMSALPTALTSLLLLRFLARSGWTTGTAILLALGYGLGTIAFPFATVFFGHQVAAFFAFGAFYLIWSSQWVDEGPRPTRLLLSGLMLGFLPVIEHPGAIASGLIALYAFFLLGGRAAAPLLGGALLGVLPLPVYNEIAFGNPQALGYGFYAKEGSGFPAHRSGLMGVSWPRLETLGEITFKPQRGLFYTNPWLAFAFLAPIFRSRFPRLFRETILCALIFVSFLLFNSGYGDSIVYWGGGFSIGPRHLLIALPFAVVLAGLSMKSRFLAPLVAVLIVATIFLMLPAAAVDPRLPYEPKDPFFGFYLPLYSRGLFATNPFATFEESPIFGSVGAWNLGRAAGVPRDLEILPLALVWAFAALRLRSKAGGRTRFAAGLAACLALALGVWPAIKHVSAASARQPGLCRAISTDRTWSYLSNHALQGEPSETPRLDRVASPRIEALDPDSDHIESLGKSVTVTFSGFFEPEVPGWYVFHVDTVGQAALYVDGVSRLKIEGAGQFQESSARQVYLSRGRHDFMVRYMSDQKSRMLRVSAGYRNETPAPLEVGLSSGTCG